MDTIFWKVIHNKFLFKKIFQHIETVEWVKYEDFQRCNELKNKKKFKDITSLKWMLVNKQYELLKYKIINGEYIKINEKGIQYIVNLSSRNTISNSSNDGEIDNQDYYRIKKPNYNKDINNENQYYDTILTNDEIIQQDIILKEILVLLLQYKSLELSSIDLIGILIQKENPNHDILELLLNEPYSVPVTAMNLDLAISISKLSILKILIKSIPLHGQIYPKFLLENSIYRSIESKQLDKEEKVEFILNNEPKLFIPLKYNFNGQVKKQAFKIIDGPNVTNSEYIVGDINNHLRVDLHKVLHFKDSTILQLIKNGYLIFSLFNFKLVYGSLSSNEELILSNVNTLLNEIQNNSSSTTIELVQEIYKLISKESKSFYYQYLLKYGEPINGLNEILYYSFIMYTFNLSKLEQLKLDIINGIKEEEEEESKYKNQLLIIDNQFVITNLTIEFTIFYLSNYNYFSSNEVDEKIIEFLFSKSSLTNPISNQDYEYIISKLIPTTTSKLLKNLPKSRNENIIKVIQSEYKKLEFKDFETIDWFFENNEFLKTFVNFSSINFSKFQFLEYAITKYKSIMNNILSGTSRDFILTNTLSNVIDICDFEDIKYFDKLFPYSYNSQFNFISQDTIFDRKSIDLANYIQLFDYLNSIKYKIFKYDSFCNVLVRFSNNCIKYQEIHGKEALLNLVDLSKIQINFDDIIAIKFGKNEIINLFISSLIGSSKMEPCSTIIELMILNHCNPIGYYSFSNEWESRTIDEIDNSFINDDGNNIKFHYHSCLYYISEFENEDINKLAYYCNSNESIDQFIKCIELLVLEYNESNNTTNIMYQKIINHLFKRLIRIKNVSINQICYIVDYVQSNIKSFQFQHSLFHSFYFIGIKSLKLIKFILRLPLILDIFNFGVNVNIDNDINFTEYDDQQTNPELQVMNPNYNGYDIKNYLNPLIYTFDYIFKSGNNYEILLESLITNLVYSSIYKLTINDKSTINSLNYVLEYLLEFKLFNLFFKHLQIINDLFKSYSMIFKYSNSLVNNALIAFPSNNYQFKEFIKLNSGESIKRSLTFGNLKFNLISNHYDTINELMDNQFNYKEYWDYLYKNSLSSPSSLFNIRHHTLKYYNQNQNLIPYDKLLTKSSSNYENYMYIDFRELLLKCYPNNSKFKITTKTITKAIEFNNGNQFLKYYYDNGTIKNDQLLLTHLKDIIKKENLTGYYWLN